MGDPIAKDVTGSNQNFNVTQVFSQQSNQVKTDSSPINHLPDHKTAETQQKAKPETTKTNASFFKDPTLLKAVGTSMIAIGVAGSVVLAPLTIAGGILGIGASLIAKHTGLMRNEGQLLKAGLIIGSLGLAGLAMAGKEIMEAGISKEKKLADNLKNQTNASGNSNIHNADEDILKTFFDHLEKSEAKETENKPATQPTANSATPTLDNAKAKEESPVLVKEKFEDRKTTIATEQKSVQSDITNIKEQLGKIAEAKKEAQELVGSRKYDATRSNKYNIDYMDSQSNLVDQHKIIEDVKNEGSKMPTFKGLVDKYESLKTPEQREKFINDNQGSSHISGLTKIHKAYKEIDSEHHQMQKATVGSRRFKSEQKELDAALVSAESALKTLENEEKTAQGTLTSLNSKLQGLTIEEQINKKLETWITTSPEQQINVLESAIRLETRFLKDAPPNQIGYKNRLIGEMQSKINELKQEKASLGKETGTSLLTEKDLVHINKKINQVVSNPNREKAIELLNDIHIYLTQKEVKSPKEIEFNQKFLTEIEAKLQVLNETQAPLAGVKQKQFTTNDNFLDDLLDGIEEPKNKPEARVEAAKPEAQQKTSAPKEREEVDIDKIFTHLEAAETQKKAAPPKETEELDFDKMMKDLDDLTKS